ncbi:hypothetical protein [Dactylosporangium sp. CS-033363]|uniref:hypothetical protein n=1 Tax=Dactylosporangium sp. CS-033363 TaxID=3239935 RepID=UPI003D94C7CF
MTFNIGNQQAANINNVAGNQYNAGGQYATVTIGEAHAAVRALQAAVQRLAVPEDLRGHLLRDAAAVERAVVAGTADKPEVAGRLERVTRALAHAGAFAAAGAGLVGPLTTLGQWLGPAGSALLALLR